MITPNIQPEKAWQMVLDQLRPEMPQASFNTWVRDTKFVSFENGVLTIGTGNTYASEWLASRLTGIVTHIITGLLSQSVTVQFIVHEDSISSIEELVDGESGNEEDLESNQTAEVISLQAEYQSVYDEIVQPDQVIVVPGYFLRFIPLLGPELSWLYIGFRQAAYEAGASKKPGKKVGAPAKKVAWFAGMSPRSFWRWAAKPSTWKLLRWLVKPIEDKARWSRGSDGRPHQSIRYYRVAMTMPLTPFDEQSLRGWFYRKLAEGKSPLATLQAALETSVDELFPWPEKMPYLEDISGDPHSIQDVVKEVCTPIAESDQAQFKELADKLAQHLMPSKDLVFLTHYFVGHWLTRLGPGPGWFVTLMRDRCYLNQRTGEIRDEVRLEQGYVEAARWMGLKRVKTIWEWLRNDEVSTFLLETGRENGTWEDAPRRIKVCLGEPMIAEDQDRANLSLAKRTVGASVSHSEANNKVAIGASGTHRNVLERHDIGASDSHSGASVSHSGAIDSSIGASCTDIGGLDNAIGSV